MQIARGYAQDLHQINQGNGAAGQSHALRFSDCLAAPFWRSFYRQFVPLRLQQKSYCRLKASDCDSPGLVPGGELFAGNPGVCIPVANTQAPVQASFGEA